MENDHRFPLSVLCVWQCPEASEEVTSVSWDQHIQSARSTRRRKEEQKKNATQSPSSLSLSIGMDSSRPVLWLSGCRTNNIPLREPIADNKFCTRIIQTFERVDLLFSSRRRHTRSLCDWSSDVCSSD